MPGTKSNRTGEKTALAGLPGWDRLRHGGLLLDGMRLEADLFPKKKQRDLFE